MGMMERKPFKMKKIDYIKVENLKDGYLYKILARNSSIGIWQEDKGEFLISRFKFGDNYLFGEIHYDLSDHFGTVRPIKEICKTPFEEINQFIEDGNGKIILNYLNEKVAECDIEHPRDPVIKEEQKPLSITEIEKVMSGDNK